MQSMEELYEGLSEDQKARAKACNSAEELLAFAKAEGIELSDRELEAVSGGWDIDDCETFLCMSQGGRNSEAS